jgi:hypothetical protein
MVNKYEELKIMIAKYGNQTNIYNYSAFDLLKFAEYYLDNENEAKNKMLKADSELRTDYARIIYFLEGYINIETLEYRLFNVKPDKDFIIKDIYALELRDILYPNITSFEESDGIEVYNNEGTLLVTFDTVTGAANYIECDKGIISDYCNTHMTYKGKYNFRYKPKQK